jgi:RNA polymerase sigma factor FliA
MIGQPMYSREADLSAIEMSDPAQDQREQQIRDFLPFIKYQVLRLAGRLPPEMDIQDLTHAGILGLLDALEKFDASRGTQLKTYAEFRIRGSILDELRAMDWASRSTREKMKRLDEAHISLERLHQRPPSEEEMAHYLGLGMEEFHHLALDARSVGLVSIDDLLNQDLRDPMELKDAGSDGDPHEQYALKEVRSRIVQALQTLSDRERLVLNLYYYEELTMKEIGLTLNVTESRVSQIHSQALVRLRARLRKASEKEHV